MSSSESQVEAAYRWILGRSADASGLTHYSGALAQGQITAADLRLALLASPEHADSRDQQTIVDTGNGVLVVVDAAEPEFGKVIASAGVWEPHVVALIRGNLKPGDVFVDIGGNVGIMSMNAASVVGPTGKVIAFEPNPRNAAQFLRSVVANGFENVVLYPVAASDAFRTLSTTRSSNSKVVKTGGALQINDVVQAIPPDSVLANEPRIDFLKIDIEGYELPALMGCKAALARCRPLVLCEFNPLCLRAEGGIDPSEMTDFIFSLTDEVEVVEHSGATRTVGSSAELMSFWSLRDGEAVAAGDLPTGWLHFDLLFRPR